MGGGERRIGYAADEYELSFQAQRQSIQHVLHTRYLKKIQKIKKRKAKEYMSSTPKKNKKNTKRRACPPHQVPGIRQRHKVEGIRHKV